MPTPGQHKSRDHAQDVQALHALEAAAFDAWPAAATAWHRGWRLQTSDGYTKRANSANAGPAAQPLSAEDLDAIDQHFRLRGLAPIYRLTSVAMSGQEPAPDTPPPLHPQVDALLARRGLQRVDASWVMVADLASASAAAIMHQEKASPNQDDTITQGTALRKTADPVTWLKAFEQISGKPLSDHDAHRAILQRIGTSVAPQGASTSHACTPSTATPSAATPTYALWQPDHAEHASACALAVRQQQLLGLFDIATHPLARRQGQAQALCSALIRNAAADGATQAYLQVVASNTAAIALYRKLGFRIAYGYWYRVG